VQALPKQIIPAQTIAKLETEIRRNQGRIERLRHRNAQLTQRLEQIALQSSLPQPTHRVASATPRTTKYRPLQAKRRQLSRQWLSIAVVLLCMVICCGFIGFAVARLIAV
jgi:TolA-binding protein